MNHGWKEKKLGELSKINYGYTEKASYHDVGPKFLRITDIQDNNVDWNNVPFCNIKQGELPKYKLNENDIVFARTGATTGKSYLIVKPPMAVFASYLIRLQILDKNLLAPKFLSFFFQSERYWNEIQKGSTGSTQGGFNASKLAEISVPIPTLPEQQRIVAILDHAFDAIDTAKANTGKNLQNARELFETSLNRVFANSGIDWEEKPLGKVTTKIGSGATPLGGERSYSQIGISLIRSLNIYDSGFRRKGLAFIDEKQADNLSNVNIEKQDVLLNITGASIARCCIVPDNVLPARVNQHVSIIRLMNNIVLPEFVHYALISKINKEKLLNIGEKGGSTRQALTKAIIEDFPIKYPPLLSEQLSIINKLNALHSEIQQLETAFKKKLGDLDELKKSLLQKAFNGELTEG
jgi:type I restriction enzyme S subunit